MFKPIFYILIFIEIVSIRLFLWLLYLIDPNSSIFNDNWHHFYTGFLILLIFWIIENFSHKKNFWMYKTLPIAMILDEIYLPLVKFNLLNIGY